MSSDRRLTIDHGKYTFILPEGDYRVHMLRHGEPWLVIEQGSKAIWSLVYDAIDAVALVAAVRRWATPGDGYQEHVELHQAFRAYCDERGEKKPTKLETGWRTDAAPRGVRCIVTVFGGRLHVASVSPDHNGQRWFSDGQPLHSVIAWMPAPGPAEPTGLGVDAPVGAQPSAPQPAALTPADIADARRLHELVASPGHETPFEIRRDVQRLCEKVIASIPDTNP